MNGDRNKGRNQKAKVTPSWINKLFLYLFICQFVLRAPNILCPIPIHLKAATRLDAETNGNEFGMVIWYNDCNLGFHLASFSGKINWDLGVWYPFLANCCLILMSWSPYGLERFRRRDWERGLWASFSVIVSFGSSWLTPTVGIQS